MLSDQDIAEAYLVLRTVAPDQDAADIVDDVERWMGDRLQHRSAFSVAVEIVKMTRKPVAPLPTPEENARQLDQAEGTTANDAALAEQVAAMDVYTYAKHRQALGMAPSDLVTFLSGGQ